MYVVRDSINIKGFYMVIIKSGIGKLWLRIMEGKVVHFDSIGCHGNWCIRTQCLGNDHSRKVPTQGASMYSRGQY